jgi:hypothetical protein
MEETVRLGAGRRFFTTVFILFVLVLYSNVPEWVSGFQRSISTRRIRAIQNTDPFIRFGGADGPSSAEEPEIEWGSSFIGQDVCGSKYNDDPFGEQGKKPDAWEIMAKKIKAIEERDNAGNKTNSSSNAGKWPP